MNWYYRVRSRRLDRLAAGRMITHVCAQVAEGHAKTRDELMIEAWLWRQYGADALADALEYAVRNYDRTGRWGPWPIEQ